MLISPVWLVPHVPTLLVDAHRGHHTEMLQALADASDMLAEARPAAAVVVSARWQSSGPFLVDDERRHHTLTDYSDLGVEVRYDCDGQPALAHALVEAGTRAGLRVAPAQRGVDSGVTVPMRFLVPERGVPVVPVSVADAPPEECRRFGAAIGAALTSWRDPVQFVVGGMLSFDPHAWRLGREEPAQRDFDERVLTALTTGGWDALGAERLTVAAAVRGPRRERVEVEGGLRHLEILRGVLGADRAGEVRCYQRSPGAGAALIAFPLEAPAIAS